MNHSFVSHWTSKQKEKTLIENFVLAGDRYNQSTESTDEEISFSIILNRMPVLRNLSNEKLLSFEKPL